MRSTTCATGCDLIVCRQEGGAAYMAEAYGKLTGRPGIAFVTRGPGASNAAIGIHTAAQDSSPMIVFVGQVGGDFADREAFQEIDYRRMYGSIAKWVGADRSRRPHSRIRRARVSHRDDPADPGPVVLALPEDMLTASADASDAPPRVEPTRSPAGAGAIAAAHAMLARRARPLVLVGGSALERARRAPTLARIRASATRCPSRARSAARTCSTTATRIYAGDVGIGVNPKLAARVRDADVLLVIGERLGEMVTARLHAARRRPSPRRR